MQQGGIIMIMKTCMYAYQFRNVKEIPYMFIILGNLR